MENLNSKKFIGFIAVSVLLTVLVLAGKIEGQDFITFITLNFSIYVGGNLGDSITKK